ncbi:MAG: hypothetical protein ACYC2T_04845 [Bacillota bacterium]
MAIIEILEELLTGEYFQTTQQLAEAVRIEYPACWEAIRAEFRDQYGPGCGELMSPLTVVGIALDAMQRKGRVSKTYLQGQSAWKKA